MQANKQVYDHPQVRCSTPQNASLQELLESLYFCNFGLTKAAFREKKAKVFIFYSTFIPHGDLDAALFPLFTRVYKTIIQNYSE